LDEAIHAKSGTDDLADNGWLTIPR